MRKTFTFLIMLLPAIAALGQKFDVDTIYKSGRLDNRINVVILGDGFTNAELPRFREEARRFSEFFLGYEPYNHYKNYFNFFAIATPSRESGVTNPGDAPDAYADQPVGKKDTYYEATFGSTIHRLVTVNISKVYDVLAYNLASYDLAVVLVNTEYYGGSGGAVAVHTLHAQANTIGVHEIAHTFSHVNDEYWAGAIYGWEAPNMTVDNNPATIKWKPWLDTDPIGIFRHGDSGGAEKWYKPTTSNCLMELLSQPFCQVCREATTERILEIVNPLEGVTPAVSSTVTLTGDDRTFSLNLVRPEPNTLKVEWRLNGTLLATNQGELTLGPGALSGSAATLTATVYDSTTMSRAAGAVAARTRTAEWKLEKLVLSNPAEAAGLVKIFPNPARDYIHFETRLPGSSQVTLYDRAGRQVASKAFDGYIDLPVPGTAGIYLYRFSNNGREVTGAVAAE
ncbi:M64 family metallopeptidase [Dyadobacter sandarakinus]|uniref:T9SS type A sorting domain-containing protein n=1 Tax=Dyadobacter sandarakinus TaxID=2747268 RepID=A0ABX7I372_9BACT|nr:M64 family metallopeptidase [Dyadobacter sandarakinus]QRR00338.1 T9SS type A sorting domain-containing protein [Dyadobacter sandarakinus]